MPSLISWSWKTRTAILCWISSQVASSVYTARAHVRTGSLSKSVQLHKIWIRSEFTKYLRFLSTLSRSNFDIFTQPTQRRELNSILHYQIIHFWNQACIMLVDFSTHSESHTLSVPYGHLWVWLCLSQTTLCRQVFKKACALSTFCSNFQIYEAIAFPWLLGTRSRSNFDILTQPTQKQEFT